MATAYRASSGHTEYQSIVQPDNKPGNFNDLDRNFDPTCGVGWGWWVGGVGGWVGEWVGW